MVTYVADSDQERQAVVLINSLRRFGGEYSESTVYVVISDTASLSCHSLKSENVILLQADMPSEAVGYPLAMKAYAAAQTERLVKNKINTLAWFDPETMVLGPLNELELTGNDQVTIRPVFLVNNIGLHPDSSLNPYWLPIYNGNRLDVNKVPVVETVGDGKPVRAYYNCEVFSVDPRLGIFNEWSRQLTSLLRDSVYQKTACQGFLQKLFLHQAVLSAVITSRVPQNKIRSLPLTCGYPVNLHPRLPDGKKINQLDSLSCAILENVWIQNPNWMDMFIISDPHKSWLEQAYIRFLEISPDIYRVEGSCNSYLVTTQDGSALIDPAGANDAPQWFRKILAVHPLKAILFTHAHNDHVAKTDQWIQGRNIPVFAQRDHAGLIRYHDELYGFFSRKNAIWSRKSIQKDTTGSKPTSIYANTFFADTMTYTLGGYRFMMTHTPGETPDHATIRIPELNAVFVGDNYYEYFINNSTFRGTTVRPLSGYIAALDTALSYKPEYFFMGHGAPVIGNKSVHSVVGDFRDALKYIYNETIKGINEEKDVYTLMKNVRLPPRFQVRPYYGTVEWTVRGLYHELTGWFDENPASMYAEPMSGIYEDLVELCGGADAMSGRAQNMLDAKDYVKVLHLTDIILKSEPGHVPSLAIRKKALQALKKRNYIENIWLDYGIRQIDETLK